MILLLLLAVLFFGIEVNGARSWFGFFGVHLQISELVKPFFIILMANFLSKSKMNMLATEAVVAVLVAAAMSAKAAWTISKVRTVIKTKQVLENTVKANAGAAK